MGACKKSNKEHTQVDDLLNFFVAFIAAMSTFLRNYYWVAPPVCVKFSLRARCISDRLLLCVLSSVDIASANYIEQNPIN